MASERPSQFHLTFVGFEYRQEGKVAVFQCTNTGNTKVQILDYHKLIPNGTNWDSALSQRLWIENNGTRGASVMEPGGHCKILELMDHPRWRLAVLTAHEERSLALVKQVHFRIGHAWILKDLHQLLIKPWSRIETVYSEPVAN
jgi:hypothetical protein